MIRQTIFRKKMFMLCEMFGIPMSTYLDIEYIRFFCVFICHIFKIQMLFSKLIYVSLVVKWKFLCRYLFYLIIKSLKFTEKYKKKLE